MAASREPPTLADYAVTAVSPMLIMLMVGSLVFFLVEVLYAGQYSDRLLYSMFFFVIGAVLVARISIQVDQARAAFYGLGLGIVTFLAMSAYVEYPAGTPLRSVAWLVNLGLMALVWWSAHKLTWDCTHIDEKQASSGRGVLSAAGLDADETSTSFSRDPKGSADAPTSNGKKTKRKKTQKHESRLWNWIGRYEQHREKQRAKGHTPGVWVIYFALAALPLFALGQSLISTDDDARRFRTFVQMAVYVGSALGLLVTTSLLGLRRYLRQRKVRIPAALTASWLGLGGVLIAAFLLLGAFLPRPHSEVPWFGIQRAGKSEREASNYAQLQSNSGKGEGADGEQTEKGQGNASGKGGEPGGGKGEKGSGGKGEKGKGSRSRNAKQSAEGKIEEKPSADQGDDRDRQSGRDAEKENEAKNSTGSRSDSSSRSPPSGAMAAVQKIAGVLKWFVFAAVAFLVIVGTILAVLRYLAPFTDWAKNLLDAIKNWWANLFGAKEKSGSNAGFAPEVLGPVRPPPFSTFSNPFEDGTASGREPREVIAYTFAALDSWAWDRGHGREPRETPLEFAARLGEEFGELTESLRRFAALSARSAYSMRPLPTDASEQLETFWDDLIHGADAIAV